MSSFHIQENTGLILPSFGNRNITDINAEDIIHAYNVWPQTKLLCDELLLQFLQAGALQHVQFSRRGVSFLLHLTMLHLKGRPCNAPWYELNLLTLTLFVCLWRGVRRCWLRSLRSALKADLAPSDEVGEMPPISDFLLSTHVRVPGKKICCNRG